MTQQDSSFELAVNAIAEERYNANYRRAFAHLGFQLAYPTFAFTDDQAEEITSIDRRGDLGCDGLYVADEEGLVLIYQSKSSTGLSETEIHDEIAKLIQVPNKLMSDQWVARAHLEMRALANEFRTAIEAAYEVQFAFVTGSEIGERPKSTFGDLVEVPGADIRASLTLLGPGDLDSRYDKVLLGISGVSTDVRFSVRDRDMHRPASQEAVLYLTIPARDYVSACKRFGMELFRYNPRLYLGMNKVNKSIAATLKEEASRCYFHLLNNGITAVCRDFTVAESEEGQIAVEIEDFQVVNGCQTSMTLFENSSQFQSDDSCLVDVKVIRAPGLRDLISNATNTQTAIRAEDSFANELEQKRIADLLNRFNPPYFYASKRGAWEQLRGPEKRRYQEEAGVFGKYRKLTSKELASVCLAIFGEPEYAKDKPRVVFEKADGKNNALYERIFMVKNSAAQWILPFEMLRYAHAVVREEAQREEGEAESAVSTSASDAIPETPRSRIGEYGRFRMLHLAYDYLFRVVGERGGSANRDFLTGASSEQLLRSIDKWGRPLLLVALDALVDSYSDAQNTGSISGLREFFREKRHQPAIQERFKKALGQTERLASRVGQTLPEYLNIPT